MVVQVGQHGRLGRAAWSVRWSSMVGQVFQVGLVDLHGRPSGVVWSVRWASIECSFD
ncbi:unnamed protein product [Lupinus luteus]|uniref:Uncharacterized protein n=1 Tax=Lupinus luteus TaxID=3873 RepID=A0AAV1WKT8_LUPLU